MDKVCHESDKGCGGGRELQKVQNKYREFPEKNSEAEKEMIYKYKLTLDLF